uniref:Uncharacterized protein n=1 Tax=Romanomermis culicivorax TaxID=13658 RepID=A0A915JDH4_ROMCU
MKIAQDISEILKPKRALTFRAASIDLKSALPPKFEFLSTVSNQKSNVKSLVTGLGRDRDIPNGQSDDLRKKV